MYLYLYLYPRLQREGEGQGVEHVEEEGEESVGCTKK